MSGRVLGAAEMIRRKRPLGMALSYHGSLTFAAERPSSLPSSPAFITSSAANRLPKPPGGGAEGGADSAPAPSTSARGRGGGKCSSLEWNILHPLLKLVLLIFHNAFKASVLSVLTARLWSPAIRCRTEAPRQQRE